MTAVDHYVDAVPDINDEEDGGSKEIDCVNSRSALEDGNSDRRKDI